MTKYSGYTDFVFQNIERKNAKMNYEDLVKELEGTEKALKDAAACTSRSLSFIFSPKEREHTSDFRVVGHI